MTKREEHLNLQAQILTDSEREALVAEIDEASADYDRAVDDEDAARCRAMDALDRQERAEDALAAYDRQQGGEG